MALPKYDPQQTHQPATVTDYFEHPEEGFLQYQPSTLRILGRGPQTPPIKQPIKLHGEFIGTKQPNVPTCSEPQVDDYVLLTGHATTAPIEYRFCRQHADQMRVRAHLPCLLL